MSSDGDSTHGEQRRTAHARDENLQSQTDHAEKHTSEPHATLVKRGLGAAESGASSKNAETHAGDTSMSSTETNADSAGVDRDVHTTATNACVDAAQHEPKLSLHVGHFASFTSEADDGEEQIPVDVHIQTDNEHSNNGEGSDSVGGDGGMECAVPESASNTEVGMTEVVDEIIAEAVQAAKDGNKERYSRDSGPEDEPEDGTEDNVRASTNNPHVLYDDNQGAAKSSPAPPRVRTPVDLSHLHSALSNSIDSSHPTHTVDSTRVPGTLKGSVTSGHAEKMGDTVQKGSAAQALPGDGVVSAHRVHMDTGSHTIQQATDTPTSQGHSPSTFSLADELNTQATVLAQDVSRVTEGLRLKMGMIAQDTLLHSRAYQVAVDQYGSKCNEALSSFIELISSCQELDEAMHSVYDLEKMTLAVDKQLTHLEKLLDDE